MAAAAIRRHESASASIAERQRLPTRLTIMLAAIQRIPSEEEKKKKKREGLTECLHRGENAVHRGDTSERRLSVATVGAFLIAAAMVAVAVAAAAEEVAVAVNAAAVTTQRLTDAASRKQL